MAKQLPLFAHKSDKHDHRNWTLSTITMLDKRGKGDTLVTVYEYKGEYFVRQNRKTHNGVEIRKYKFDTSDKALAAFNLL